MEKTNFCTFLFLVFSSVLCNTDDYNYKYDDYPYDENYDYNNQKPEDYTDDYSQGFNDYYDQNLPAFPNPPPSIPIPPPPQPPMGDCIRENEHIRRLTGSKTMDVPGWTFYGLNRGAWEENPAALSFWPSGARRYPQFKCSNARWFGYCGGICNVSATTKFNKCGRAHLNIGNCFYDSKIKTKTHFTEAKLNGQKVLTVKALENKAIEFDFKDGDIFELADIGYGVIALYDIKDISCSLC